MKKGSRSFIVLALVVSFVTGPTFFGFATKANADTGSCLAGVLAGLFKGKADQAQAEGEGISGEMMSVPTYDAAVKAYEKANQKTASNTSGQTQGFTVQRCIVEPMVIGLARSLLNTFTAQTIAWINGGFKGSPLFVTNPQGFLTDIADQTVGQFIEGLGPIGEILCSPFDFQLRLSLNLQFGNDGYRQEIGCRLTDIQQNVQRAFTGGNFGQNGWDNWLDLTAYPQNNPYGAYIKGVNALDVAIVGRQTISLKELDWGKGFLSAFNGETGEITTPGSLIESNLTETLGVDVSRVGLAKDLDAILGALVNQLINQVMGPGGLLGATRSSGSSGGAGMRPGQTPVQRILAQNPGATVAENAEAQNLPEGVLPYDETTKSFMTTDRFCTAFQNNLYFVNKADNTVWGQVGTRGVDGKITYGNKALSVKSIVVNGTVTFPPWTLEDYNSVVKYCKNYTLTSTVKSATDAFTGTVDEENKRLNPPPTIQNKTYIFKNLAPDQPASQSGTYFDDRFGANKAVNRVKETVIGGCNASQCASVTENVVKPFWEVSLAKTSYISSVRIYKTSDRGYQEALGDFTLFVLREDRGKVYEKQVTTTSGSTVPLEIASINAIGKIIRIQRNESTAQRIELAEVEVMGTEDLSAAGKEESNPGSGTSATKTLTITPETIDETKNADGTNRYYNQGANFPNQSNGNKISGTLNGTTSNEKLKVRVKLLRGDSTMPISIESVFSRLNIVVSKQERQSVIYDVETVVGTNINPELTNTAKTVTVIDGMSFTANHPATIDIDGTIFSMAITTPSDHQLIIEIVDSSGKVIATQTIKFKLQ